MVRVVDSNNNFLINSIGNKFNLFKLLVGIFIAAL